MSYKYLNKSWEDKTTQGNVRLAYLSLADQANDDGICWPSKRNIHSRMNCSKRTADVAVAELLRIGLLHGFSGTRKNGRNTSNHYILVEGMMKDEYDAAHQKIGDILGNSMERIIPPTKKGRELEEKDKTRMGADRYTPMVQTVTPSRGADRYTPMVQTVAPDPLYDPSTNHKENPHLSDSAESDEDLQSHSFEEKEKPPQKKKAAMRNNVPAKKKLGSDDLPEMRPIDTAFGIFQRLAEIDPSISSKRGQVLRDAKALLNGNNGRAIPAYSPQDILDCAEFIIQDPWRISNMVPLTSQTLIERLPKWIAADRPPTWADWKSKAPSGNAAADELHERYRDKTDDPEAQEEPLFG